MKEFLGILRKSRLFSGVGEDEIESMLGCLDAKKAKYAKGEYVYRSGEHVKYVMILAEGKLHIQNEDYWGNRSIINYVGRGDMFGEAYASPDHNIMLNDVVAVENSTVLFFDVDRILSVCPTGCKFHSTVMRNLFYVMSEKNRLLVTKLGYVSQRTTREKLLSYLSDEAKKQGRGDITIPFNRQQLADFLGVDRSAMSNELCKMRHEGIIEFDKNRFTLKL